MLVEPPEVTNGPPTPETFHIHKLCKKNNKKTKTERVPHIVFLSCFVIKYLILHNIIEIMSIH